MGADKDRPVVKIYTDGACSGNPGPGGYGVVLLYNEHEKELSGGYRKTTNNRMELLAVCKGLEALKKPCKVQLYSDSRYVLDALSKGWAARWKAKGWWRNKKEMAKNPDLWELALQLCSEHTISYHWVRGHSGDLYNERADRLAVAACKGHGLAVDVGFEQPAPLPTAAQETLL